MKGKNKLILCHAEMVEVVTIGLDQRIITLGMVGQYKVTNITENRAGGHSKFEITLEETKK